MTDVSKLLQKKKSSKRGWGKWGGGGGKGGGGGEGGEGGRGGGASTVLCIWQISVTMTGVTDCNLSTNL